MRISSDEIIRLLGDRFPDCNDQNGVFAFRVVHDGTVIDDPEDVELVFEPDGAE